MEDSLRSKFNSPGRREVCTEVSERSRPGGEGMAPWAVGSEAEALPGQTGSVPTRAVIALQTSADTPSLHSHGAPALTQASPDLGPHGPQERKLTWEPPTLLAPWAPTSFSDLSLGLQFRSWPSCALGCAPPRVTSLWLVLEHVGRAPA